MDDRDREIESRDALGPDGYESPRVEQVLTPDDLEREVLYAGEPTPLPPPP
jgi:hypothetical protein